VASKAFKRVEQLLEDYPKLDSEIKKRRLALLYPVREHDENVGGSKSQSNTSLAETFVVTLDQDKRLARLEEQKFIIEEVLKKLHEDDYNVIKLYYFEKPRTLTWDGIAMATRNSRSRCFEVRKNVVEEIGRKLGELD